MQTWRLQTAKARFSEMLKQAANDGRKKSLGMAAPWRW